MATYGGPNYNIGETYNEFVDNINSNGGTLINIPSVDLKQGMSTLQYDPSILMVPNGFIGDQLPSMIPTDGIGDFTVSRNGTATYFDKNGVLRTAGVNEPRFDYDPLTGEYKGVLVEPNSTNILTHSYNLGYSPWNSLSSGGIAEVLLFPNQAEAPDGTFTAARYLSNIGGARSRVNISVTAGVTYTVSFWAKNISMTKGNSGVTVGGSVNYLYIPLINTETWTRISYTFTALGTGNANYRLIQGGNIGGEILLWGAQFEETSKASSYIPTYGSSVTRPSDIISIPSYSSIFGQRNQRVININGTNQAIINDSTYILPEGHNKFTFEKTTEFTSQEINDLNIETIQYGIRDDIKSEYQQLVDLNPSLILIPGIGDTGSLQTLIPNDGTGDFTVSRNGTATYFDKDGLLKVAGVNEPRLEFDPLTGEFKGVLVEPSRTNLISYSQNLETWTLTGGSVIDGNETLPDGTLSPIKFIEDISTGTHNILHNLAGISGGSVYTFSFFAKPAGRTYIQVQRNLSTAFSLYLGGFLLEGEGRADLVSANNVIIQKVHNGWYKCSVTATALSTTSNGGMRILLSNLTTFKTSLSYEGDGTSGVYLWGAQFEENTSASSYIPTSGSSVTRPADIISVPEPIGISEIITKLDGEDISQTPTGGTYQLPFGYIKKVIMK